MAVKESQKNSAEKQLQCVGFIMDGNRRWARAQGQGAAFGHKAGFDTFEAVVRWVTEANIPHAVFYGLSTENWYRSQEEVTALLLLIKAVVSRLQAEIHTHRVRWRFVGRLDDFPAELKQSMSELETVSKKYTTHTIWVALSYGGRAEIMAAVNRAIEVGKSISEEEFATLFWSAGMPDPDIIIRTGGEQRLSNFLPWQSVYSELYFTPTFWPAFTKEEFHRILDWYAKRERRLGR